jgi:NAD(P)-dependent dehydrogenase (short-subunit alcohol dehydrogenase family)
MPDMKNKTIVITGATSGIGEVAAIKLAEMGARLVLVARDKARAEATLARLRSRGPDARHTVHYADLSRIAEMKRVAAEIAAAEPRIDVLINNAGAVFNPRAVTADGLEMTFAVNHMGYFVLTEGLRARLAASAPARIVSTASDAHRRPKLDFDDLQSERGYNSYLVYGRSKLANVLHTRELARRLAGSGVTANCLHPGFVATRFADNSRGTYSAIVRLAKTFAALTPEQGAETLVYLASSPEVANTSGGYFHKNRQVEPSAAARNDSDARRLWEISEAIAARTSV